jgi:cardiolipin synthase
MEPIGRIWKRPASLEIPPHLEQGLKDLEYAIHPASLRPGNRVLVLHDGQEAYPSMLEAIRGAREYVHLETYILQSDRIGRMFGDALCERARAGVAVRLLFDSVGAFSVSTVWLAELRAAGVQVAEFRPIAPWRRRWGVNKRDHRKILVVDGTVGFTGGLNIGEEYESVENGGGGWHDIHARVEGPAVAELARLFRRTWVLAGGTPYPVYEQPAEEVVATSGTAFALAIGNEDLTRRASIRRAYLYAMRRAKKMISLENAYFIPDRGIRRVLANAVKRGVSVRVIVPGNSDLKSAQYAGQWLFAKLLKAGVKIFVWPERMMHAKTAVVDSAWSTIGSYNLDARSLFHNLEATLAVVDRTFGAQLQAQFDRDVTKCRELELAVWKKRPWWMKVFEWCCYQFRHWL